MNNEPSRELGSGHWAHGEGYEGTITTYVPTTYLEEDEHPAVDDGASPVLVPPDLTGQWWRQPDQGGAWRDDDHGGVIVAAVTGILVAAVATGVATFAAALVRPQASPAGAAGGVLFARIPASLSHLMVALFGAYAQAVLLLAAIGLVAAVFGVLAGRNQIVGVGRPRVVRPAGRIHHHHQAGGPGQRCRPVGDRRYRRDHGAAVADPRIGAWRR